MSLGAAASSTSNISVFARIISTKSGFSYSDRETLLNAESKALEALSLTLCLHNDDDVGEFSTLSVVGEYCSSWAVARQGGSLLLWNARSGADVGTFSSMVDVIHKLAALAFPAGSAEVMPLELTNIKLKSNVFFLTAEQLGQGTTISKYAA